MNRSCWPRLLVVSLVLWISACSGSGGGAGSVSPDPDRAVRRVSRDQPGLSRPPHETVEVVYLDDGVGYAVWEQQIERRPQVRFARYVPRGTGFEASEILAAGRLLAVGSAADEAVVVWAAEEPDTGRFLVRTTALNSSGRLASRAVATFAEVPASAAIARDGRQRWGLAIGRRGVGVAARVFSQIGTDWAAVGELGSLVDPLSLPPGERDAGDVHLVARDLGFVLAVENRHEPRRVFAAGWVDGVLTGSLPLFGDVSCSLLGLATDGVHALAVGRADLQVVSRMTGRTDPGQWGALEVLPVGTTDGLLAVLGLVPGAGGAAPGFALALAVRGAGVAGWTVSVRNRSASLTSWGLSRSLAVGQDDVTDLALLPIESALVVAWRDAASMAVSTVATSGFATRRVSDAVGDIALVAAPPGALDHDFVAATTVLQDPDGSLRNVALLRGRRGADFDDPVLLPKSRASESKSLDGLVAHTEGLGIWSHGAAPRNPLQVDSLAGGSFAPTHTLASLDESQAEPAAAGEVVCVGGGDGSLRTVWDEQSELLPLVAARWGTAQGWGEASPLWSGDREPFWRIEALPADDRDRLLIGRGPDLVLHDPLGGPDLPLGDLGIVPERSAPVLALRGERVLIAHQAEQTLNGTGGFLRGYENGSQVFEQRLPGFLNDSPLAVGLGAREWYVAYLRGGQPVMLELDAHSQGRTRQIDQPWDQDLVGFAVTGIEQDRWARIVTWTGSVEIEFEDGPKFAVGTDQEPRARPRPTIRRVGDGVLATWWEGPDFVVWSNSGSNVQAGVLVSGDRGPRGLRAVEGGGAVRVCWLEDVVDPGGTRLMSRRFDGVAWTDPEVLVISERRIAGFDVCVAGSGNLGIAWIDAGAVWSQVLARD